MDIDAMDLRGEGREFSALTLEPNTSVLAVPCMYRWIPEVLFAGKPNAHKLLEDWQQEWGDRPDAEAMETRALYTPRYPAILAGSKVWHLHREVPMQEIEKIVATKRVLKRGEHKELWFAWVIHVVVLRLSATAATDFTDERVGLELIERAFEEGAIYYYERRFFPGASYRDSPQVPQGQFTELTSRQRKKSQFQELVSESRGQLTDAHRAKLAQVSVWARSVQSAQLPRPYQFTLEELNKQLETPEQTSAVSQLAAALSAEDAGA